MKAALLAVWLLPVWAASAASTINATNRYAYGANVGWLDWRGDDTNGAIIGTFICAGYLYGANVGWLHLGSGSPVNGYAYGNLGTNDYGVNHDGAGNLRGYAYGANIGWVAFETQGAPTVDLLTGNLSGYAYGANVGWISLSNAQAFVQTDALDTGPDTDGDGIPDQWEYARAGNLTNMNATSHGDGDGVSDKDEYGADTDPFDTNDYLRVTALSVNSGGTTSTVTWSSHATRLYRVLGCDDLLGGAWATNTPPGLVTPDSGATTTRAVPGSTATQRFFRVQAVLPPGP